MKTITIVAAIAVGAMALPNVLVAQTPDPLSFFPHHTGDVWQYRSQFTGELVGTRHIDSVKVDSLSRNIFIYFGHSGGGGTNDRYRIDSVGNLYNLNFQPDYVRYKLYADSGQSWQAGVVNDTVPVIVTVMNVYQAYVFGIITTVKAFRFVIQNPPPRQPFWLGTDHLAKGFGLVKTEIEPSDVYYLAAAIIDTAHYGNIVSIKEKSSSPQSFDLLGNYPNPFNPSTQIKFDLPEDCFVTLNVFDVLGRKMGELANNNYAAGYHSVTWNANEVSSGVGYASGVYFVRFTAADAQGKIKLSKVIKLLLAK